MSITAIDSVVQPHIHPGQGRKVCPKCRGLIHSRQMACPCGYSFRVGESIEAYLDLAERRARMYVKDASQPIRDTEQFGDACLGLAKAHDDYDQRALFSTWARRKIDQELIVSYRHQKRRWHKEEHLILEDISQERDDQDKFDIKSMVELLLADHPNDTSQDKVNRSIIVQWMNGVSFDEIAVQFNQTKHWVRRRWARGIITIRTRYSSQLKEFE